eukprot:962972-Rhodomonas_salina.2
MYASPIAKLATRTPRAVRAGHRRNVTAASARKRRNQTQQKTKQVPGTACTAIAARCDRLWGRAHDVPCPEIEGIEGGCGEEEVREHRLAYAASVLRAAYRARRPIAANSGTDREDSAVNVEHDEAVGPDQTRSESVPRIS